MAVAVHTCPCCDDVKLGEHCSSKACDCYRCQGCGCWGTRDGRRRAKHSKCTR